MNGNKSRRWRPERDAEQEEAYDGYKNAHAWSVLVCCNLFERFIRVEISNEGAESDRNTYTSSDVNCSSDHFLCLRQYGMVDMGFAGKGALVVP